MRVVVEQATRLVVLNVVKVGDVPALLAGLDKIFPANALQQLDVLADTLT